MCIYSYDHRLNEYVYYIFCSVYYNGSINRYYLNVFDLTIIFTIFFFFIFDAYNDENIVQLIRSEEY